MARGVIRLANNIQEVMPVLCRRIEGCAYNPEAHLAAFNLDGMSVVMTAQEIMIHKVEDREALGRIADWLKSLPVESEATTD